MNRFLSSCVVATMLAACAVPQRPGGIHPAIQREMEAAAHSAPRAKPGNAVDQALIPPLRIELPRVDGKPLESRFDLSVRDAPAQQVFTTLVNGTRYSMLVHPDVAGRISVTLKDVTVIEALNAIRELYGYEYKVDGSRISIQPNTLQTRVFKVNYIMGQRVGRSDLRVGSNSLGSPGQGSGFAGAPVQGGFGNAASGGANTVSSSVSTVGGTDFWTALYGTLQIIVGTGNAAPSVGSVGVISGAPGAGGLVPPGLPGAPGLPVAPTPQIGQSGQGVPGAAAALPGQPRSKRWSRRAELYDQSASRGDRRARHAHDHPQCRRLLACDPCLGRAASDARSEDRGSDLVGRLSSRHQLGGVSHRQSGLGSAAARRYPRRVRSAL